MAQVSDAAVLLAKMEREGFPPIDPHEFQVVRWSRSGDPVAP